jgi:hypothetical protein
MRTIKGTDQIPIPGKENMRSDPKNNDQVSNSRQKKEITMQYSTNKILHMRWRRETVLVPLKLK